MYYVVQVTNQLNGKSFYGHTFDADLYELGIISHVNRESPERKYQEIQQDLSKNSDLTFKVLSTHRTRLSARKKVATLIQNDSNCYNLKLKVNEKLIRSAKGKMTVRKAAKKYNTSPSTITRIWHGNYGPR